MRILDAEQIARKLSRMAIELLERHVEHRRVFLLGINNNGFETARRLRDLIAAEGHALECVLRHVRLSPADPMDSGTEYEGDIAELAGAHVVIVDDVANTGRTAYYACRPIMAVLPASVEVAVLVDRRHKSFPVSSDYVGLTLATTLQEDIRVYYDEADTRVELF